MAFLSLNKQKNKKNTKKKQKTNKLIYILFSSPCVPLR
nr:MAG TPA: hypothetical protein [Caudoviricetes sp.]DAN54250.1 MAG TPA: hypothetical protein [Caudoviricetes sp.]